MIAAAATVLMSCGENKLAKDQEEVKPEIQYTKTEFDIKIDEYLKDKSWKPERQTSGLYVYKEKAGSDKKPTINDYVTIFYKGYFLDGTVFDGTKEEPATFPLARLIKGWQEGIPHFGKGGKGKLVIPPAIGYGPQGGGPIPPNSILVFEIELVDFSSAPPMPKVVKTGDYSPEINEYLKKNDLKAKETGSGLFVVIDEPGGKEKPDLSQEVTIHYKGYLLDGTVFDGSKGTPAKFRLNGLIAGWQEGIPFFGKGGKGKLILPPYLGYGERGSAKIPGNSVIVFDIELVDFKD